MNSILQRLFFVLLATMLVATSCSSSSGETTTANTGDNDTDTSAATSSAATSIPVPADDAAAGAAIAGLDDDEAADPALPADPAVTAQSFMQNRFNISPGEDEINCIADQTADDSVLDAALRKPSVAQGEVDDTDLKALSFAIAGCVDALSLGDWATEAVGPQGDVRLTAPSCFAERFDDADRGDVTFYTFVALTYQFRVEPEGVPDVTEAFVECAPISGLVDFFAEQYEARANFTTEIDRDCAILILEDSDLTLRFWSALIEGLQPPIETVIDEIDPCAVDLGAGFSEAPPSDFVPWSATGALREVLPASRAGIYTAPPPMTIDADGSYEAIIATGGGEIRIRLLADTAPLTVNNFVNLARDGYYDDTVFHRVISGFMAQGGDPTGTGTGGPGYSFADEFDGGPSMDRKGLLAMANSGPATNGSQFFITFDEADYLTGAHTIFGEVIDGIDILDAIAPRDPQAPNGRGQVLESVTIIEN